MNTRNRASARAVRALQVVLLAVAYLGAALLALELVRMAGGFTLLWPPTGIAMAALLRYGRHLWPGVALGAAAALALTGAPPALVLLVAAGHTLEAWLAARWLEGRGFDAALCRVRDVVAFLGLAVVLATGVSATFGGVGLYFTGLIDGDDLVATLVTWWVGNAMGALVVAPWLLVWLPPRHAERRWSGAERLEAGAVVVAGLATAMLVFSVWPGMPGSRTAMLYLPVLVMLWAAVRFDMAGACVLVAVVNTVAVLGTVQGGGPFAAYTITSGMPALWMYMGAASATMLGTAALVAERRRATEALQRSRAHLAGVRDFTGQVIDSLPGIFYLFDEQGRMQRWNRRFQEVGGFLPEEILDHHALEFVGGNDQDRVATAIRRVFDEGETTVEATFRHKDGSEHRYLFTGRRIDTRDARFLVGVGLDVTERVAVEHSLRQQSETLQRIIDNIPIMLCFIDHRQELQLVNREWVSVLGWSLDEARDGGVFRRLYPDPAQRRSVIEHLARADSEWREYRTTVRSGRIIDTIWTAIALSDGTVIGIGQDVTELRRTREELYQVQRMESIGRLSAGIAHDFNNLLVPILGYLETALDRLPADNAVRDDLEVAHTAAGRAADLTRQILAFSRQQMLELSLVDVNAVVAEFRRMLDRLLGENIRVSVALAPELPPVKADPGQVEQTLLNLAVNARDAMPDGGELAIETRPVDLAVDPLARRPDVPAAAGHYVALTVRDNGVGMDAATRKHIFEPFFTSKERGRGTGLGLSTVFGIVKQHQGYVSVVSAPGQGAEFTILLPASEAAGQILGAGRAPAARAPAAPAVPTGETVLVVEDEVLVRELVCEALTAEGYRVIEAQSPADAVERARRHPDIDLLLSDVVMPGMGGREVHRQVAAVQPHVRVMFMSGYAENPADELGIGSGGVGFLHKPFTIAALLAKVRSTLQGPPSGLSPARPAPGSGRRPAPGGSPG